MKHFKNFFQAVLKSKANVLSVWKRHISPVRKFLSDKFESIFWVSKTKLWNFFKSRDSRGKRFGKWFWCYLTWKANVLSVWKWSCFLFANFWVAKLKPFSGKARQSLQKLIKLKAFDTKYFTCLEVKSDCFENLKINFLTFFANFWMTKLRQISRKTK